MISKYLSYILIPTTTFLSLHILEHIPSNPSFYPYISLCLSFLLLLYPYFSLLLILSSPLFYPSYPEFYPFLSCFILLDIPSWFWLFQLAAACSVTRTAHQWGKQLAFISNSRPAGPRGAAAKPPQAALLARRQCRAAVQHRTPAPVRNLKTSKKSSYLVPKKKTSYSVPKRNKHALASQSPERCAREWTRAKLSYNIMMRVRLPSDAQGNGLALN